MTIKSDTVYIEDSIVYERIELESGSVSISLVGDEYIIRDVGSPEAPEMVTYRYDIHTRQYVRE